VDVDSELRRRQEEAFLTPGIKEMPCGCVVKTGGHVSSIDRACELAADVLRCMYEGVEQGDGQAITRAHEMLKEHFRCGVMT